jgi:hypothetical protein
MSKDDFFIGWAETSPVDRRFFLGAGVALLGGTGVLAGTMASLQNHPGKGNWNMSAIREFRGIATSEPYAMLRTTDVDGAPKTALLACQGKCGVSARIGALSGQQVVVKGSLIQRGRHAMIAVVDGLDWIRPDDTGIASAALEFPDAEPIGEVTLRGEILDTKCWFGAMRPSNGKVHKSCASLCIRGGLPPAFYVKDINQQKALLIMTEGGLGFGPDLLSYVADPIEARGFLRRQADYIFFDTSTSNFRRL